MNMEPLKDTNVEGAELGSEENELPDVNCIEEAAEIVQLVQDAENSNGESAEKSIGRWKTILSKYQEESHMLDSLLESIVTPLAQLLRTQAIGMNSSDPATASQARRRIMSVCRMLNVLVTVRGYKTVVKFFPHEAADLEAVLEVLLKMKQSQQSKEYKDPDDILACWETQTMLLLWLSILILIPFELATVDTAALSEDNSVQGMFHAALIRSKSPYTILVSKILNLCKDYLHQPGGVRDMAALLLGRLLTRPDQGAALREYLAWASLQLQDTSDSLAAPFLIPGVLYSLGLIFKLGKRTALLPLAASAWQQVTTLHTAQSSDSTSAAGVSGVVARMLTIKLAQRIATTFLEPRLAPWRYQKSDAGVDIEARLAGHGHILTQQDDASQQQDHDDEDFELVEEIEQVIDVLLTALRDKDTIVRWSAAKGVGRVTGCLPKELGDEVVESIMDLFKPTESDMAWHGGCLALAELARRGLLLPERLPSLVPIIEQALLYDVRRGPHSIGAHVRDAAAYVCWAFARAYAPEVMSAAGVVDTLAATLLTVACYDREVNCRRAAAAAFQESVGRLGNFPHGIDLLTVADYFAVGNINNAYLVAAVSVAQFETYNLPLARHLLHTQLRHWEKPLRELSARALAKLVPCVPASFLPGEAVTTLLGLVTDSVLEARHGAVVGVAELLPALQSAGRPLSQDQLSAVANVIPSVDAAKLFRGKGGEVMSEASCKLVAAMSEVNLVMSAEQHDKVLEVLDDCLKHAQVLIQRAAVRALAKYSRSYFRDQDHAGRFKRYMSAYLSQLHDPLPPVRRGYALALGALPSFMVQPQEQEVLDALIGGTAIGENADDRDTDSRVACVRALTNVCITLYKRGPADSSTPQSSHHAVVMLNEKILPCFHTCLTDYTTDNRGDVGSLVREAAMEGLATALDLMAQNLEPQQQAATLPGVVPQAAAALIKQGVERIARVREAAMKQLRNLLAIPSIAAHIPAREALSAALPTDDCEMTGVVSVEAVKKLAHLMTSSPAYLGPILESVTCSIGGFDAQLSKAATEALTEILAPFVKTIDDHDNHNNPSNDNGLCSSSRQQLTQVCQTFVSGWRAHAKSSRMAGPYLRTADLLVTTFSELATLPVEVPATTQPGSINVQQCTFCDDVAELTRAETRGCSDVARLMDAATLLCHLVSFPQPCTTSSYQGVLLLLCNKYPKVRRHTAEQLYLALLPMDSSEVGGNPDGISPDDYEAANELVLSTAWDGAIDDCKMARDQLAALLQVQLPAMKAPTKKAMAKAATKDGFESYQSLLDDFARGVA